MDNFVTQRFDVINDLFKSMGLPKLLKDAEKKAKRKNLLKIVKNGIDRRHEIVHNGDVTDYGRLRDINHKQIRTRLINIQTLVNQCESIINKRFK